MDPSDPKRRAIGRKQYASDTLAGRVHEYVHLQGQHDVMGLYAFLDPVARERLESDRADEPEQTLAALRTFVQSIRSIEIEDFEIVEAHKGSPEQGERPAALVRLRARYNDEASAEESRTLWVRDQMIWYRSTLGHRP